jgi:hypothetical protein
MLSIKTASFSSDIDRILSALVIVSPPLLHTLNELNELLMPFSHIPAPLLSLFDLFDWLYTKL